MQVTGREDGANAVKSGEGFMFKKMEEWNRDVELKDEYPRLGDYL